MPVGNNCPFAEEADLPLFAEGSWGLEEMGGPHCCFREDSSPQNLLPRHTIASCLLLLHIFSLHPVRVPSSPCPEYKGGNNSASVFITNAGWSHPSEAEFHHTAKGQASSNSVSKDLPAGANRRVLDAVEDSGKTLESDAEGRISKS